MGREGLAKRGEGGVSRERGGRGEPREGREGLAKRGKGGVSVYCRCVKVLHPAPPTTG